MAMFLGSSAAAQQISGNIRGTVSDPTGAAVQGATVSAKQAKTGQTRTSVTDHSGAYEDAIRAGERSQRGLRRQRN